MAQVFRICASALVWFAIVLQYWLVMSGGTGPQPLARTVNFLARIRVTRSKA